MEGNCGERRNDRKKNIPEYTETKERFIAVPEFEPEMLCCLTRLQ